MPFRYKYLEDANADEAYYQLNLPHNIVIILSRDYKFTRRQSPSLNTLKKNRFCSKKYISFNLLVKNTSKLITLNNFRQIYS